MPQREAIHYATSRMRNCHSREGNCWDNAPSESWFGSFKSERVYGERFETRDEVIAMTFEYIECVLQPETAAFDAGLQVTDAALE